MRICMIPTPMICYISSSNKIPVLIEGCTLSIRLFRSFLVPRGVGKIRVFLVVVVNASTQSEAEGAGERGQSH